MKAPPSPRPKPFRSPLAASIRRFLDFKRALGCRYRSEEQGLRILDRYLSKHLSPRDPLITHEIVRGYISRWGKESDTTRGHRFSLIRELCKFVATEDPRTPIPPTHSFPIRRPTFVPKVLTLAEASSFLAVCSSLPPGRCSPLRGTVHGTVLTVLYLTGLRVGEAFALTLDDVDLVQNVLHVRKGKFGKARFVPIAPDLGERLRRCREKVHKRFGTRLGDAPFFPGPKGKACTKSALRASFHSALQKIGISPSLKARFPRVHDLRHAYACHRMILWFKQGANLEAKMPLLATYLGHVSLSSSQRYLRLTEDLLGEVTRRHQARFGYLIQERNAE